MDLCNNENEISALSNILRLLMERGAVFSPFMLNVSIDNSVCKGMYDLLLPYFELNDMFIYLDINLDG